MNDWVAVRCCCQPTNIFGFLRLDRRAGPTVSVPDIFGSVHQLELKTFCSAPPNYAAPAEAGAEIAVYSDDRGIDFWRRIPGFVEALPPVPRAPLPGTRGPTDVAAFSRPVHMPGCASNSAPAFTVVVQPRCDCGAEP
jgi:hypothetical protein